MVAIVINGGEVEAHGAIGIQIRQIRLLRLIRYIMKRTSCRRIFILIIIISLWQTYFYRVVCSPCHLYSRIETFANRIRHCYIIVFYAPIRRDNINLFNFRFIRNAILISVRSCILNFIIPCFLIECRIPSVVLIRIILYFSKRRCPLLPSICRCIHISSIDFFQRRCHPIIITRCHFKFHPCFVVSQAILIQESCLRLEVYLFYIINIIRNNFYGFFFSGIVHRHIITEIIITFRSPTFQNPTIIIFWNIQLQFLPCRYRYPRKVQRRIRGRFCCIRNLVIQFIASRNRPVIHIALPKVGRLAFPSQVFRNDLDMQLS